jgi:DNTTIP1 dimerisation domain
LNQIYKPSSINGSESLEILRANIQYFFNAKIDVILREFIENFFHPAIENIKYNLNENVTENQVRL